MAEDESEPSGPGDTSTWSSNSNRRHSLYENWVQFTSGAGGKNLTTGSDTHEQTPTLEQKFKLEFAVDSGFMEKLEEAKAILSKKYPCGVNFEQLFEAMLDEFLEKHSPKRKILRRNKRKAQENVHVPEEEIIRFIISGCYAPNIIGMKRRESTAKDLSINEFTSQSP